nr:MAG TPA: hypothetical protein [Caudoviricetes sp.]
MKGESRKALRSADFRHKKDVRRRLLMFRWCEGRTRTGTGYSGLACFKNHC